MPNSNRPHPRSSQLTTTTRLYSRGHFYYFRVVLPNHVEPKPKRGRLEIRLSLRTAYRQTAKKLAHKLYFHLGVLLEEEYMLDYTEIKRRMNLYLRKLLERDHNDVNPRNHYNWPELDINLTAGEMSLRHADMIKSALNDPDRLRGLAEKVLPVMIQEGFLSKEEVSEDNYLAITKAYLQMQITFHQLVDKREKGDFLAEEPVFAVANHAVSMPLPQNDPQTPGSNGSKQICLHYSEALEKYIEAKVSDGSWKKHSVADHRNRLESFLEIMGDKPIDEISRQQIRKFRDTLRKLPPNRKRSAKYKNKTIEELLALNVEVTLNVATVNVTVEAVASFLDWCVREEYLTSNPAKELQIKDTRQAIDLREPFSIDDLRKIFSHQKFTHGKFKNKAYFWLPLIGLYTGMRLEEIAQLHCGDLYKENGIWVIDINDRETDEEGFGKTVKNSNAVRIVPVHQMLVDLGLIVYRQEIVEQGSVRLFPQLKKTNKVGKYGKQPGKQFKAVVVDVLDNADKKSFHSLRHTFSDFYKQRGLQTDMFRQLYGHDIPELAARQYGSKFPPELLFREIISKLDYGIDIKKILSYSTLSFAAKP